MNGARGFFTCTSSTTRWNQCRNRARVRIVTWTSSFGLPVRPVSDGPLDMRVCTLHARKFEWQRELTSTGEYIERGLKRWETL